MSKPRSTESNEIDFRFATSADLPEIVALLADDPLGSSREVEPEGDLAPYRQALEDMRTQGGNHYLVAEAAGRIVGCVQIVLIPGLSRSGMKRAQLEGVRVAESMRGRGLGRRLIEEAISIARREGCGLVQLTTDKRRPQALSFYRSLGFTESHLGLKYHL